MAKDGLAWLYRLCLMTFPRRHRLRYEEEMVDAFSRERMALRQDRRRWAAARFALAAFADAVSAGIAERRSTGRRASNRSDGFVSGVVTDLRHAGANLTRAWSYSLVCLASLAIGLGINLAISILLLVSLAPPPAVEPEGAVEVVLETDGRTLGESWTFADFEDVRRVGPGADLTAWAIGARSLAPSTGAEGARVDVMFASTNYFSTMGVRVSWGRSFARDEDTSVGEPPIVVSHDAWENQLGASIDIVGRQVLVNGVVHTVVGVAPEGFRGHFAGQRVDAWVPLWTHPRLQAGSPFRSDRREGWLQVLGRLNDGVTEPQVSRSLGAAMQGLAEAHPATNQVRSARAVRYSKQGRGDEDWWIIKRFLLAIQVVSLVIVCLNIAGMVLVRGTSRARELAVRMALGSSRARLVRYLMAESVLLAVLGGVLSLSVATGVLHALSLWVGQPMPEGLNWTLAVQTLGWSFLMMFLIGLSPALQSSRPEVLKALKDDSGVGGRRTIRTHRRAASWQTAVALPLLVITGMVVQSLFTMDREDHGFRADGLVVSTFDLAAAGYSEAEADEFLRTMRDRIGALPGVDAVSVADAIPLDYRFRDERVSLSGEPGTWIRAQASRATEGYFAAIETSILRGRGFERGDARGAEAVAVVTRSLAARLWPDGDWLGQRFTLDLGGLEQKELSVVGVSADLVGYRHGSASDNVFISQWQAPARRSQVVLRSDADPEALRAEIRDLTRTLDAALTPPLVLEASALTDQGKGEIYGISMLVGGLSTLMLFLVGLGVYGVVGFAVTRRTREIGVRMAMGASRPRVLGMVLTDGLKLALPGLIVGSIVSVALSGVALSIVYDYFGRPTLVGGVLMVAIASVLGVVLLASGIPARRATGVRPMDALRTD